MYVAVQEAFEGRCDAGRTGAVHHDFQIADLAAGDVTGIDDAGDGDDGRAVLVVMEDRYVEQFAQALFDDEAFRRLDVFQIDAAERVADPLDAFDEGIGIGFLDLDVHRVDIGKALEQHRLAFHHRLGGERAEIAEAEDRGAVGNHRDQIAPRGVVEGARRVFGDGQHRHGDAGRIGQREIALGGHGLGRRDLQLARAALLVKLQRLLFREAHIALARFVRRRHIALQLPCRP